MLGRYRSEIRTGCANERPSGSVRGAPGNWCPYRDQQLYGSMPAEDLKSGPLDASISFALGRGISMPVKQHSHKHPEVEHLVRALEAKTKKLEKAVRDLQRKFKTHDHPHTH